VIGGSAGRQRAGHVICSVSGHHFRQRSALLDGNQPITTISELRAPNAARGEVEKAREAILKGKFPEAHKQLDCALKAFPNYAPALMPEGIVNAEEQNFAMAEQNLNVAIKADPYYGPAYLPLAAFYNDTERYDDALRLLNRAMPLMASSWLVYLELSNTEIWGNTRQPCATLNEVKPCSLEIYSRILVPRILVQGCTYRKQSRS